MKTPKPLITLVFTLFATFVATAQISIFYNPINSLKVNRTDVFNVTILVGNNTPTSTKFKLYGLIINKQGGVVLEATTQEFTLNTGSNNVSLLNINTNYDFKDKSILSTGVIPYGSYRFECQMTDNFNEPVSFCETDIDILPLSPPQLAFPDDKNSIETTLPVLFWIPPFPVPTNGVNYYLKIAEILPNQSSNEAISVNLPILEKVVVDQNSYQYTPANFPLSFGKAYSWQVTANDKSGALIGQTEIWEFRIEKEKRTRNLDSTYIILNNENLKRTFKTQDKILFIKFEEKYKQGNLKTKVSSLEGKIVECQNLTRKESGENRISLDFSNCQNLKQGEIYLVEIELSKSETYLIRAFLD